MAPKNGYAEARTSHATSGWQRMTDGTYTQSRTHTWTIVHIRTRVPQGVYVIYAGPLALPGFTGVPRSRPPVVPLLCKKPCLAEPGNEELKTACQHEHSLAVLVAVANNQC